MQQKKSKPTQKTLEELISDGKTKKEALEKIIQKINSNLKKQNNMKIFTLFFALFSFAFANAQWTNNLMANTLVSNAEATDAKSATTSTGETIIVFWSPVDAPTNYELRMQKLDVNGNQQFPDEGLLVSDSIPMGTFTQVWSLTLDANDNIYIGATGTNGNKGFAFKLDSDGNALWGTNGKALDVAYLVRVFPLSNGDVMLSWLSGSFNGNIQKFDSDGAKIWDEPIGVSSNVPANVFEMSNGNLTTIYHQLGRGINSTLFANQYDQDGNNVWNDRIQLFESGVTAYNTEYSATQDADTIYYSYKLAHDSRFDAYVQRINPNGDLPWGIDGLDFDVNENNYEQEIQIITQPGTNVLWALCRYTNSGQSDVGIRVQKINKSTGERLFSDSAKAIFSVSPEAISPAGNLLLLNGLPAINIIKDNKLYITLLDDNADFYWGEKIKPISELTNTKGRIMMNKISEQEVVVTFIENKGSGNNAYAQNFKIEALSVNDNTNIVLQYNNPISNNLTITSTETMAQVSIYSISGQTIDVINANSHSVNIHSNQWQKGMYIAHIRTLNGTTKAIRLLKD